MIRPLMCVACIVLAAAAGPCAAAGYSKKPAKSEPLPASVVTNWPTGQKLVALTYDDGPNPKITPKLLELLKSRGAKATFFLLGEQLPGRDALVRQIVESGNEIANHTATHRQLTKLSDQQIVEELSGVHARLREIAGVDVKVMRPPYGSTNARVAAVCEKLGYHTILWDVDTNDWRKVSAQTMINTILKQTSDGSIILMHDRFESGVQATAAVLDELQRRGYRFVTVSEMLSQPRLARGQSTSPARIDALPAPRHDAPSKTQLFQPPRRNRQATRE